MIADRRAAIEAAIREAKPGDMVLIAGKGHEDYQIVGTTKHHFDDREVARETISTLRSVSLSEGTHAGAWESWCDGAVYGRGNL